MGLNSRMLAALLFISLGAHAQVSASDKKFNKISSVEVSLISTDVLNQETSTLLYNKTIPVNPLDVTGKVIEISRNLVALGEDVYKLVIKGKPSNKTDYTPISVIPKINGEPVDLLDTENWKNPIKRTYRISYKNVYGIQVVTFRFSVLFGYGGSYDGKGAYLTGAQIIPEEVNTLFGFDFSATMKLGGIMNQGTRANPVAVAILNLEHTVNSLMVAHTRTDSFMITGRGGFRKN